MRVYYFKDKKMAFQKGFPFINADGPVIVVSGEDGVYADFPVEKKELEEIVALINQSARKVNAQKSFAQGIKNVEGGII